MKINLYNQMNLFSIKDLAQQEFSKLNKKMQKDKCRIFKKWKYQEIYNLKQYMIHG